MSVCVCAYVVISTDAAARLWVMNAKVLGQVWHGFVCVCVCMCICVLNTKRICECVSVHESTIICFFIIDVYFSIAV